VEEIEAGVEQFVASAHPKEHPAICVVELHGPVTGGVHELVAAFALEEAGVEVEPVAAHVDAHRDLEEEGGSGVEGAESRQQAHRRTTVSQHVQHAAKPGALAQHPSSMSIHGIQETGQQVASHSQGWAGRHEPERQDRQEDSGVTNQIRNEQKYILGLGQLVHEGSICFWHRRYQLYVV